MHLPIIGEPREKAPPGRITDALREVSVSDEVGYLQVFVGNEIARCHERACRFTGKVFTLPTDFQIRLCQCFPGFLPILRLLLLARKSSVQLLQAFFGFAQMTRVSYSIAF